MNMKKKLNLFIVILCLTIIGGSHCNSDLLPSVSYTDERILSFAPTSNPDEETNTIAPGDRATNETTSTTSDTSSESDSNLYKLFSNMRGNSEDIDNK